MTNVDALSSLSHNIKKLRKVSGFTQIQFAKLIGIDQPTLSRAEEAKRSFTIQEIYTISKYFDVSIDSLISGHINYCHLAEKFSQPIPFPAKYRKYIFSTAKEVLPFISFANEKMKPKKAKKMLEELMLEPILFMEPKQKISTYCIIDIIEYLIDHSILTSSSIKDLVNHTRSPEIHSSFDQLYNSQDSTLDLIRTLTVAFQTFDMNFKYDLKIVNSREVIISVTPEKHMKHIKFKNPDLPNIYYRYKKLYISEFPKYRGWKPLKSVAQNFTIDKFDKCENILRLA